MRPRLAVAAVLVQVLFILGHVVFYLTWLYLWRPDARAAEMLAGVVGALSLSFIAASLVALRRHGVWARLFYTLAAAWLGIATYLFLAACACWVAWAGLWLTGTPPPARALVEGFYGLAAVVAGFGMLNAAATRVRRVSIRLKGLPADWQGAEVALVSDLHLGHVRNRRFARRTVALINRLRPRAILIAGDLFDGTACDADRLAQPWSRLAAPDGAFYVAGNHESYGVRQVFLDAAARAGLRVLDNQKVVLAGLQLVGVHFAEAADAERLRDILERAALDPGVASILLTHAPDHVATAERAGVSLLLAGHTHGGQYFPVTAIVRRIYGRFTHGLQRQGGLQVYTSYGAGTWGPPLRVGTTPEVVLLTLLVEP